MAMPQVPSRSKGSDTRMLLLDAQSHKSDDSAMRSARALQVKPTISSVSRSDKRKSVQRTKTMKLSSVNRQKSASTLSEQQEINKVTQSQENKSERLSISNYQERAEMKKKRTSGFEDLLGKSVENIKDEAVDASSGGLNHA